MATLEQFLRTGDLGSLHPGMTPAKAIALLGPPPDASVQREPKILKYGGLQLTFARPVRGAEQQLVLTGLYFRPPLEPIPESVSPADFNGTSETTLADVRAILDRVGMKESAATDGEDSRLDFPSGASIVLRDGKLWSILFAVRVSAPPKKQISISIPEEAWQQLNSLARQSNRSIAELCAQWITQQATRSETSK